MFLSQTSTLRHRILLTAWAATLLLPGLSASSSDLAAPRSSSSARIQEVLRLKDMQGRTHVLGAESASQAYVLAWTGIECPMAQVYLPRLRELAQQYREQQVEFFLIHSNVQDSREEIAAAPRFEALAFPMIRDEGGRLAERFHVTRTTEVLVFDAEMRLNYRGAVDDQYGYRTPEVGGIGSYRKPEPERHYLIDALDAVLAGRRPKAFRTDPMGCALGLDWEETVAVEADSIPTYHADIEPLLQRKCQSCHRDGGIAPFALDDFEQVSGWRRMIREAVSQRRMPPWGADPTIGHFRNARSLSEQELETLLHWIDGGAPRGKPEDAPAARSWPEGWEIGTPDVVYEVPEYEVDSEGRIPYRYVMIDTGLEEDRWVQAAQIRSNTPEVVHHVLTFVEEMPGAGENADRPWRPEFNLRSLIRKIPRSERRATLTRLSQYTGHLMMGDAGGIGGFFIAATAGDGPTIFPEGQGVLLPARSKILFQIHYTPNGMFQDSITSLALRFCDEPPQEALDVSAATTVALSIPPGAADHVVETDFVFPRGAWVTALAPHMHLRGKSASFAVEYPDGRTEDLLSVPEYDFDWQDLYLLERPKRFPKGTRLKFRAVFDNSADNPDNPDPTERVYFGLQSEEEMCIGYFQAIWDRQP